jgi:agmatinase
MSDEREGNWGTDESRQALEGDQAFSRKNLYGTLEEATYSGALSFGRRLYTHDLRGADVAILGVPADLTVSNRPGTRFGPRSIRAASAHLSWGEAWPWGFDPFKRLAVVDVGDVVFEAGYVESLLAATEERANWILNHDVSMVTLGGEHLISLPVMRAHARKHGPFAMVHFDAHSDTWVDEVALNHGTMFRNALQEGLIDTDHSIHVGIRTHNHKDHGIEILDGFWLDEHGATETAERIRERVADRKAYLTFDIDCLDPCYAPGTGTPVTGGPSTAWARRVFASLHGIDFIGMDIVEVAPEYDVAEITSLAAATLVYDYLCLMARDLPEVEI